MLCSRFAHGLPLRSLPPVSAQPNHAAGDRLRYLHSVFALHRLALLDLPLRVLQVLLPPSAEEEEDPAQAPRAGAAGQAGPLRLWPWVEQTAG